MKTFIYLLFFAGIISCNSGKNSEAKIPAKPGADSIENAGPGKRPLYESIMKNKNFSLQVAGDCEDALEDTLHERGIGYVDLQQKTDTGLVVKFRIKEACCQEFMGDYSISNDTLKFVYEQVNDEVCTCICWYVYTLTLREKDVSFKHISIQPRTQ